MAVGKGHHKSLLSGEDFAGLECNGLCMPLSVQVLIRLLQDKVFGWKRGPVGSAHDVSEHGDADITELPLGNGFGGRLGGGRGRGCICHRVWLKRNKGKHSDADEVAGQPIGRESSLSRSGRPCIAIAAPVALRNRLGRRVSTKTSVGGQDRGFDPSIIARVSDDLRCEFQRIEESVAAGGLSRGDALRQGSAAAWPHVARQAP